MHDVSIIIPFRGSDPHRQANLIKVLDWLTPLALPMILASDSREDGQPFNRSAAFNEGMRLSPSEVYVFNEADMLVPHWQILAGVEDARDELGLVVPFSTYRYMSEDDSRQIIAGADPAGFGPEWIMDGGKSIGAVNILSAASVDLAGGFDETLEGHGYDDNCVHSAFETACAPTRYVIGDAYHLWHKMAYAPWERRTEAANPENFSDAEVRATTRNRLRYDMYRRARSAEDVRVLTAGGDL